MIWVGQIIIKQRKSRRGAINVSIELIGFKIRDDLDFPYQIIFNSEFDGNKVSGKIKKKG